MVILKGKNGESYNIANPNETLKVIQLAKIISKISNKNITFKKNKNLKRNNFKYPKISVDKIKKLGWRPSTNLPEGIKRTLNYFKKIEKKN